MPEYLQSDLRLSRVCSFLEWTDITATRLQCPDQTLSQKASNSAKCLSYEKHINNVSGLEKRTHSRTTLGIDGSLGKPCPTVSVIGSEIKFDVLKTARMIEQGRSKEGRDAGWDNLKG